MEALHIIKENPTKNVEDVVISQSKFEIAFDELRRYLGKQRGMLNWKFNKKIECRNINSGKSILASDELILAQTTDFRCRLMAVRGSIFLLNSSVL